jgi:hypothetical protein
MTGASLKPTCGNCRYAAPVPSDLTQIECKGVPPTPVALPHPQGVQISPIRPRLPRTEPACALHKAVVLIEHPAGVA